MISRSDRGIEYGSFLVARLAQCTVSQSLIFTASSDGTVLVAAGDRSRSRSRTVRNRQEKVRLQLQAGGLCGWETRVITASREIERIRYQDFHHGKEADRPYTSGGYKCR